jgi:autotransporter adhesin
VPASNDTDNTLVNSATVDFGAAAGDANVSHFAIFDAATAGKMIASKAVLGGAVAVGAGQPVSFGSGDLSFEIGSA